MANSPEPPLSLIRRVSQIGTRLHTLWSGAEVGRDSFGNVYYKSRRTPAGTREKRWVIYAGEPEASKVPPEWHIWLHHTADAPLAADSPFRKSWQKPHQPNLTGLPEAYFPPGDPRGGGQRPHATGDYQAWAPDA